MKTVGTFEEVRELGERRVGLVPTMGFLHEGHMSLIRAARADVDTVVVSLFVNPLQFNQASDLASYPSDVERDTMLAADAGADILFAPAADEMYPSDASTAVTVEGVSEGMEGAHRPGHFRGVATIVAKLFAGVQPNTAYFGHKDAQQLAVVQRMARNLSFPVDVQGMPTVREQSGLALSSRNVRIPVDARGAAPALSAALFRAAEAFDAGERSSDALESLVREHLSGTPEVVLDYVTVADAVSAKPVPMIHSTSFIALAAKVGGVRLIDNVFFDLDPETHRGMADRGTFLDKPSILYGGS